MPAYVAAVVLVAYASLALELAVLRVPSVASTRQLWAAEAAIVAGYSTPLRRRFALSKSRKALYFVAPVLVIYAVFSFPFVVIALGPDPLGDYLFSPRLATDAAGLALICLGRLIALAAMAAMRRGARRMPDSPILEVTGLFRWSRNPGLLGMYLFAVGLWLAAPSAAMLVGIVVYVVHMDAKVRMEEDFLENRFGDDYVRYRMQTGRYLP